MAEKGGTKILGIVTVCIMLISIGFSGCIGDDGNNNKKDDEEIKKEYRYWYRFEINCSSGKYDLNVPFPAYQDKYRNHHLSPIYNELKVIKGNASFEFENTSFGPSLKISGKDYSFIELRGDDVSKYEIKNRYSLYFLSMVIDEDEDGYFDDVGGPVKYQIYLKQNITLNITLEFSYTYLGGVGVLIGGEGRIQSEIKQGWNIVNGLYGTMGA